MDERARPPSAPAEERPPRKNKPAKGASPRNPDAGAGATLLWRCAEFGDLAALHILIEAGFAAAEDPADGQIADGLAPNQAARAAGHADAGALLDPYFYKWTADSVRTPPTPLARLSSLKSALGRPSK